MDRSVRRLFFVFVFLILIGVGFFWQHLLSVRAEQNGSSPDSGATSQLQTIFNSLVSLGYGSTTSGSWGDWGASWNQIHSAAVKPFNDAVAKGLFNGTGGPPIPGCTTGLSCYPQSVGGVDDYSNNGTMPTDSYRSSWTTCNSGNNYCDTGRSVAKYRDENTGLVWSPVIASSNWFVANNCKYPNGLDGDDGVCDTSGEVACQCVKHTGEAGDTKTGCEGYDDSNWRLPYQKEPMQAYVDGSWNAIKNSSNFWVSTTRSQSTNNALVSCFADGFTYPYAKTSTYAVVCVR